MILTQYLFGDFPLARVFQMSICFQSCAFGILIPLLAE